MAQRIFFIGVSPFARVLQAEQYVRQGKLNSALDAYYDASQDTTAAAAKRMVKGQAQLYLNLGYVENAQSLIKKILHDGAAGAGLEPRSQRAVSEFECHNGYHFRCGGAF